MIKIGFCSAIKSMQSLATLHALTASSLHKKHGMKVHLEL